MGLAVPSKNYEKKYSDLKKIIGQFHSLDVLVFLSISSSMTGKMRLLVIFVSVVLLVHGSPLKTAPTPPGAVDKLEGFPWIKASKAKARFGPTTHAPLTTDESAAAPYGEDELGQQEVQPVLTNEMLQSYIAALTAQLQPFVVKGEPVAAPMPSPTFDSVPPPPLPPKKWKAKVPKQVNPDDAPATTEDYWAQEKKLFSDSFYDEFYMDWLRKRQIEEEMPVATPAPVEYEEQAPPPAAAPPQPYPMMNPYMANPFMYPLVGFKVSKAMAQAQVNAALAAFNITTTAKPVKIKLKIPIPAGEDLATVVASGIAGFPTGTTYELSKKKK